MQKQEAENHHKETTDSFKSSLRIFSSRESGVRSQESVVRIIRLENSQDFQIPTTTLAD